jgi:hypothetical protein
MTFLIDSVLESETNLPELVSNAEASEGLMLASHPIGDVRLIVGVTAQRSFMRPLSAFDVRRKKLFLSQDFGSIKLRDRRPTQFADLLRDSEGARFELRRVQVLGA